MSELPSLITLKSILKISTPSFLKVFFTLRELIRTPKTQWTNEQKKWWGSLNIILGQFESELQQQQRKTSRKKSK